ncbi:MAG: type I DNA topoisomerase [Saprospirales bacterium]|nr:type I DNA topoisomerase [Saprospirales bacterium]
MPKNLLIVESPAKAKTIEKILGKDFTVKSSYGHIRDLPKSERAVDIEKGFEPKYIVTPDKHKVVKELKEWVKKVDEVWLATDEDREGEAISWHLAQVLGLDETKTKRIVFSEITPPAILKAVQSPRSIDRHLVDAQQARRVLDRLVGYELSELLWKKVKGKLSAGRVQSVAVRLIVDREREIQQFDTTPFYKVSAQFKVPNEQGNLTALKAEAPGKFDGEKDARGFLEKCIDATFTIGDIEVKPQKRRPAAPFTTSTLQQEASRKMGFAVKRTMVAAQKLYEQGFITYMRTDSTNLSELALQAIAAEIENQFGKRYLHTRRYKSKSASAQEAHEAIRPTYIEKQQVPGHRDEQRLYELIWKRTIASQMADAELEKTIVQIGISTMKDAQLQAEGEVLTFDGFLKVYLESKDDEEDEDTKGMLPPLKVGQVLNLQHMDATQRFTRPPARYTEAGLVKKLEELGIGRPSTFAPTISKIMEEGRGYVVKESRDGEERTFQVFHLVDRKITQKTQKEIVGKTKNQLFPTDMGSIVCDFLVLHFDGIMDYGFTADIEKQFDEIALGKENWKAMLGDFYHPFHATVEKTLEEADRASGERILGMDPVSGRTVLVRLSRLGKPVIQIGKPEELEEGEKPRYANLRAGQNMESVALEEALESFQLPRTIGQLEDQEVSVGEGRFGPYVRFGDQYISIPRNEDPMALTMDRAMELIHEKRKADAPIGTYKGEPISKGKGRFGPFLKWNGLFINIPRKYNPDHITLEEAHTLIEEKLKKEANRYIQQWEAEQISIENGRWGPFVRFKKKMISLPKVDGKRMTDEDAALLSLEAVKKVIEAEVPDAFTKKTKSKK